MTKVIIADDHQLVIDGIISMLESAPSVVIIGHASNGKELIESELIGQADLVLMDVGMPVMNGLDASEKLRNTCPQLKILVLTTFADQRTIKKMLNVGVDGYLLKDSGKDSFLEAITKVMQGEKYYDQRVTEVMMDSLNKKSSKFNTPTPLTEREKEVIRLIAEGLSTNEIAERLFLSTLTVETHRKNISTKLGTKNVAMLVRYAIDEGLVD